MAEKMPIQEFVNEQVKAYDRKDGYIFGAKGQNPKKLSNYYYNQYSGKQKTKALYWKEHAARVWDCNGMAEGIYEDYTGVNIDTCARYNYSGWCSKEKGTDMKKMPKEPGVAVFIYSKSAGYITHVGYLWKPVDASKPNGDWYVQEARGVMYGVVCTKLQGRGWNRWGKMHKYFDYSGNAVTDESPKQEYEFGHRLLKKGCTGKDVTALQEALIDLGYSCGKYGADGDFGNATENAVISFQEINGLEVDGKAGNETYGKIKELLLKDADIVEEELQKVLVIGGSVNVRDLPSTKTGRIMKVAHKGDEYSHTGNEENGWFEIYIGDEKGWISGKYAEVKK